MAVSVPDSGLDRWYRRTPQDIEAEKERRWLEEHTAFFGRRPGEPAPRDSSAISPAIPAFREVGSPRQKDDIVFGPVEGVAAYGAQNGIRTENVRNNYVDNVRKLDPFDNAGRSAEKQKLRKYTPAPQRQYIRQVRSDTGPNPGSVGHANQTNPEWTRAARRAGNLGRGLGVVGLGLDAFDIATAKDKGRAAAGAVGANAGGIAGGIAGAELGAMAGSVFPGPGTVVGAVLGGLGGALGLGYGGRVSATKIYDELRSGQRRR